ncbi:MAG: ABC transporter substrate-binding protein, partial [Oscillospiraceae bacterium]|nr:ABC transporter substrate-binding protein [Oscillospiraceae bacterium]
MKKVLVFGLILALALSLVGVGVAESAAYKDTMRVGVNSDQTTLDPQNNRSNNIVLSQIYNGLAKRDMDNQLVPDLAESWEVSEDELTWTFHLKKGVKFHNGVEFTARDVKATIERTIDPVNTVNTTTAMNFIKSVNIVDDYTVQLMTE